MTKSVKARQHSGFTIVEVVVAIFLVMVVMTAALPLVLNGAKLSASQQRKQVAVTVASDALERVRAHTSGTTVSLDSLVSNRTKASVQSAWSDARYSGIPGLNTTYPAWDNSSPSGTGDIPVTYTDNPTGTTDYDVAVFIGSCYQNPADRTNADCGLHSAGGTTDNGTGSGAYKARMARVIVVVRWSAGEGCTAASDSPCQYHASTLYNLNSDQEWRDDL